MATGIKLFHSRKTLTNYILVKPTENKVFLYKLNKDGTIANNIKPLLKKTYNEYFITRKAYYPSANIFESSPHRYHKSESKTPRSFNNIPNNLSQMFSIKNKDGETGKKVFIEGSINNKGKICSIGKLNFPLEGYNLKGITNLARIYLRKTFNMYSQTPPNLNTYYIDPKLDRILIELDKEYKTPPFCITPNIQEAMKTLSKKHKIRNNPQ